MNKGNTKSMEAEMDLMTSKEKAEMGVKSSKKEKNRKKKERLKNKMKKKAVLIGLKHPQMNGISDVKAQLLRMKDQLVKLRGFSESNITLMIDQDDDEDDDEEATYVRIRPTDDNIRIKLCSMVAYAKPGDILYIHLIAYGCSDGRIITADGQHLPDCYFRGLIGEAVLSDRNLTFVSDCLIGSARHCPCPPPPPDDFDYDNVDWDRIFELNRDAPVELGGYLTLQPTDLTSVDILNPNENKNENENKEKKPQYEQEDYSNVILLLPFIPDRNAVTCPDSIVSEILCPSPSKAPHHTLYYGGFTNVVLDVIEETHGQLTNMELAQKVMDKLGQIPSLRCSHHHHAYASFVC